MYGIVLFLPLHLLQYGSKRYHLHTKEFFTEIVAQSGDKDKSFLEIFLSANGKGQTEMGTSLSFHQGNTASEVLDHIIYNIQS